MAERPNFKKAPEADGKKAVAVVGSFKNRLVARIAAMLAGKVDESGKTRVSRRKQGLAGRSHAPIRKNGAKEMARRVRQIAKGMIAVSA